MKHLKTLILIDDDEIVVYLTKRIVSQTKIVELIKVFNNGKDAIEYLKENINNPELLPEIIFLDLFMPIMDGWEFLDEYITISPRMDKTITIYVISSSVSPADISRAKKYSEVSDYIIKPVTMDHFRNILKNL